MSTLGSRIKWARERAGLTQGELADRVGVTAGSRVSEWENEHRQPSAPVLMALPGVLGVSGHWLLTGDGARVREQTRITADTLLRAIQRILSGEIPTDVVRMLASPSASAYLTGERSAEVPLLPEPAVPSAIMRRKWLAARILHHEAPYYLDDVAEEARGDEPRAVPEDPVLVRSEGGGDQDQVEGEDDEAPGSIYEDGYVWGHLAH